MPYRTLICLLFLLACLPAWAGRSGDGLALSYASYPELAAAVRQRIDDKAAPSPALTALAHELTAGRTDRHARALALADWVRTNVRHTAAAGLRLNGAPPRPAAAVLAQRSGNHEELVVLLRALLAESGIASTAALVKSGGIDALPEPAMSAAFDHMLVYLPDLDLYLDPGADSIAAGYLPPALLGRPVLLANGSFAMTPLAQRQSVSIKATVDIGRDGNGAVQLDRTYTGALARPFRMAAGDPAPPARAQFVRRMLPGLSPQSRKLLTLETIHPDLSTIVDAVAGMPWDSMGGRNVPCPAVDAADETRYQLPKQLRILALPGPVSVTEGGVFYRAAYERQGNAVLVTRRLTFRNGRPTCTPAEVRAMRPALARIARDLRSSVTIATR